MNRLSKIYFLLMVAALAAAGFAVPARAAPPGSPYLPGETLNPSCAPTDTNCTVVAPPTGTGAVGRITYWLATSTVSSTQFLFWDDANGRLGVGTAQPSSTLHIIGGAIISGNATTSNLSILNLASTGSNVCLLVGAGGVISTSTCATAGVSPISISATGTIVFTNPGYLLNTNNLSDLSVTSTARTNIGFNFLATGPVTIATTTGGNVTYACATCLTTSTGLGILNFATTSVGQWANNGLYLTTSTGLSSSNFATTSVGQWVNNGLYLTTSTGLGISNFTTSSVGPVGQ